MLLINSIFLLLQCKLDFPVDRVMVFFSFKKFPEESVTFNTLKGLKNRGVKVELGFPYEMWDTPDAEVTRLKSRVRINNLLLQ